MSITISQGVLQEMACSVQQKSIIPKYLIQFNFGISTDIHSSGPKQWMFNLFKHWNDDLIM